MIRNPVINEALERATFILSPPIIKMWLSEKRQFTRNYTYLNALSILINLAPHLEVTGQKLFCDKLLLMSTTKGALPEDGAKLSDPSTFGQAADGSWGFGSLFLARKLDTKEDYVQDIEKDMLLQLAQEYLVRVWLSFPHSITLWPIQCYPELPLWWL